MPNFFSPLGRPLLIIAVTLLLTTGEKAFSARIYFYPTVGGPHNFRNYPLYRGDFVRVDTVLSKKPDLPGAGYIRRERNGDLVIVLPNVVREKYRIRFFDDNNNFLFEVRQIRDPLLIVEKYNFQHAGRFQYELYRENLLIERSTFLIRKD